MTHRSTASESETFIPSQESGYNTMAAPNCQREDSMPIPIPRTSSTGSSIGGDLLNLFVWSASIGILNRMNRIGDIMY